MSASLTTSGITMPTGGTLGDTSSAAPLYMARAWANFNGTVATPSTIRGSGNVSSITKNGTGQWVLNFTTAMPDINYAIAAVSGGSLSRPSNAPAANLTTGATVGCSDSNTGQGYDNTYVYAVIFR